MRFVQRTSLQDRRWNLTELFRAIELGSVVHRHFGTKAPVLDWARTDLIVGNTNDVGEAIFGQVGDINRLGAARRGRAFLLIARREDANALPNPISSKGYQVTASFSVIKMSA
jgi:hypothetical protein